MPPSLSSLVLIPLFILVSTALGILLLDLLGARARLLAWVSLTGLVLAPALELIVIVSDQGGSIQGLLVSDGIGALWTVYVCGIGAVSILLEWQDTRARTSGSHHALILFAVSGAIVVAQSIHLLPMAMGLLVLYVSLDGLSGPRTAWRYLSVHGVGFAYFIFGIALLYAATGSFQIHLMADALDRQHIIGEFNPLSTLGLGFLIGGVVVPIGVLLFDTRWSITDSGTHAAESLCAALLPGIAIAALGRLAGTLPAQIFALVALLGALITVTGYTVALRSRTITRVLRGIALAQAGFMLAALVSSFQTLAPAEGWGLVFYTLLSSSSSLLGLWAWAATVHSGARKPLSLADMAGLGRRHPRMAVAVTLCLLGLAGVPPLSGSIGQLLLFRTAAGTGSGWLVGPLLANTLGAWLLAGQWVAQIWRDSTRQQPQRAPNPESLVLLLVSVLSAVLAGLYAQATLNWLIRLAAG